MNRARNQAKTIIDIADELGLSKTTVADALRGTGRVAPATREKVRRLADSAGYRANKSARQLRTNASETVGICIGADVRRMPFYMPFTFGAMEEAAAHGLDVTLITHVAAENGPAGQLAGAVVIDVLPDDPVLRGIVNAGIPVVSAGRLSDTTAAATVEIGYAETVAAALDALRAAGATRPVLVAPPERDPDSWSELIVAAYSAWCRERQAPAVVERIPVYASNEDIKAMLERALAKGNVDGFLFSWQDVANRAEIMLTHKGSATRAALRLGTLVDAYNESAHYPYDVIVDLDARGFGVQAMRTLHNLPADIRTPMTHQHAVRIIRTDKPV